MPESRIRALRDPPVRVPVSLAILPPADTERWVARRKAQVVAAVQAGLLSIDEALARYKLTLEEFTGWQRALYRHGMRGLQITQVQVCKLAERRKRGPTGSMSKKAAWSRQHA